MTTGPRFPPPRYGEPTHFRAVSARQSSALPIDDLLPELVAHLRVSQALVLTAPPGSGKTTRVPPALLDLVGAGQLILLVQPRRLAARAVARFMARALDEPPGQTVGYRVRFDDKSSAKTRLLVITEGILTRMLLSDPLLEGVGAVLLDEFHERSAQLDLALAFLKETLQARDDLRLVVMSATLDPAPISRYLGGCPTLTGQARQHPLTVRYARPSRLHLEQRVAAALGALLSELGPGGGDVLVFLPGAPEIRRTEKRLAEAGLPGDPEVVPLFGALPAARQDLALVPSRLGRQRVILATNIAETSLTVPGVRAVLDSGLQKRLRHDPRAGLDRLERCPVSQASAQQRAGRAGRLGPGLVHRLYTEAEHASRPQRDPPELLRLDLAPPLLSLLAFSPGDPREVSFLDAPPDAALDRAEGLLRLLGALPSQGYTLTGLGKRMAALPLHPRLGAVLDAAHRAGHVAGGALLCALIAERDVLAAGQGGGSQIVPTSPSDLLHRAELVQTWEARGRSAGAARALGLNPGAVQLVLAARDQLLRLHRAHQRSTPGKTPSKTGQMSEEAAGRAVLAGYPDRVCCRRSERGKDGASAVMVGGKDGASAVMVGGHGVRLAVESGVREHRLFMALWARAGGTGTHAEAIVTMASGVEESWLEQALPHCLTEAREVTFDASRGAAVTLIRRRFVDLVLAERQGQGGDPSVVATVLAEQADRRFEQVFRPGRAARQLVAKVKLAARLMPEASPWPDLSEPGQRALLAEQCVGRHSLDELRQVPWASVIGASLTHAQRQLLERELPDKLSVPSGRQLTLDYSAALDADSGPVLAVKLQEMFGQTETPKLCRGRLPLTLHLLAPNGRPAQITSDLKSFWQTGYPLVRKELRGRYPKHPWPEDPLTATPTAKAKPRR